MKKFLLLAACVLLSFACRKNPIIKEEIIEEEIIEKEEEQEQEHGIIPSNIDQIVDIFELKFDEIKRFSNDTMDIEFSVTDVIDYRFPCYFFDFPGHEFMDSVRTHVFLKIECMGNESNPDVILYPKVSSIPCGTLWWDIPRIREELQKINSAPNQNYFKQEFPLIFNTGVRIINTPFSLFLATVNPVGDYYYYHPIHKNEYSFIFILTNKNEEKNENN